MSDDLSAKLDVLIKLQAAALIAPMTSAKERILFLHKAGLKQALIAEILGTTSNHVNVALYKAKKPSKSKLKEE